MAGDIETSCVLIKPEALSPLVPLDYQPQSTIRVNADLLIVLVLVVVLVLGFLVFATLSAKGSVISNQWASNQWSDKKSELITGPLITDYYSGNALARRSSLKQTASSR